MSNKKKTRSAIWVEGGQIDHGIILHLRTLKVSFELYLEKLKMINEVATTHHFVVNDFY